MPILGGISAICICHKAAGETNSAQRLTSALQHVQLDNLQRTKCPEVVQQSIVLPVSHRRRVSGFGALAISAKARLEETCGSRCAQVPGSRGQVFWIDLWPEEHKRFACNCRCNVDASCPTAFEMLAREAAVPLNADATLQLLTPSRKTYRACTTYRATDKAGCRWAYLGCYSAGCVLSL